MKSETQPLEAIAAKKFPETEEENSMMWSQASEKWRPLQPSNPWKTSPGTDINKDFPKIFTRKLITSSLRLLSQF